MTSVGRLEPRGVCYGEWNGVRCRDLPESGGATQNPLQRVEQDSSPRRGLPESSDLSAEARLGCLMERNSSLSHRSRRSSDIFEVAMSILLSEALGAEATGENHLL